MRCRASNLGQTSCYGLFDELLREAIAILVISSDLTNSQWLNASPPPTSNGRLTFSSFHVFAPVGVIVDDEFKISQFRGATGDYLEPAPGRVTFHLLKMARGNLGLELRSLIQQAKSSERPIRKEGFGFRPKQGAARNIALEVAPIRVDASSNYYFLILFEEPPSTSPVAESTFSPTFEEKGEEQNAEMMELKQELAATKRYLQSTIEETEVTNEELKSANEEIMSSNEELQSTNEELETAKEELQSVNEELTTVNEEVQTRNNALSLLNNDLNNFLNSVNVPVVMLERSQRSGVVRTSKSTKHPPPRVVLGFSAVSRVSPEEGRHGGNSA